MTNRQKTAIMKRTVIGLAAACMVLTGCASSAGNHAVSSEADSENESAAENTENPSEEAAEDEKPATSSASNNPNAQKDTETVTTENASAPGSLTYDLDTQLPLIEAGIGDWRNTISYAMYTTFCITDLDQDGLLEIAISDCEGSGIFTTWYLYEVNASMDGIHEITDNASGATDLGVDGFISAETALYEGDLEGYYDPAAGTWYYLMYDLLRDGITYNTTAYYLVNLTDTDLEYQVAATRVYSNDKETFQLNDETNATSEEDLLTLLDGQLQAYQKTIYTVEKIPYDDTDSFYDELVRSAQGWSVRVAE